MPDDFLTQADFDEEDKKETEESLPPGMHVVEDDALDEDGEDKGVEKREEDYVDGLEELENLEKNLVEEPLTLTEDEEE